MHKKMKTTHAQSGLCVVFFAYACLTNVHTGETKEISTSTRERKMFFFLCLFLCLFHACSHMDFSVFVLISRMFTLEFFCGCAYFTHVHT